MKRIDNVLPDIDDDPLYNESLSDDDKGFERFEPGPDALAESMSESQADLLRELANLDSFMVRMVAEWLGYVWDAKKEDYVRDESLAPTMNITGARWCVNQLRVYIRNENMLTALDKNTYMNLVCDNIDLLYTNLPTRRKEFGLKSTGDVLKVCLQIDHAVQIMMIGASGTDTYRSMFKESLGRREDATPAQQPTNQGGMFGAVKRFFGGN